MTTAIIIVAAGTACHRAGHGNLVVAAVACNEYHKTRDLLAAIMTRQH
jgi:hypothetical protein